MPTRAIEHSRRSEGHITEFIQAGKYEQAPDGVVIEGESNFTESVATVAEVCVAQDLYKKFQTLFMLPELFAKYPQACSNPLRRFGTKTKKNCKEVVRRLVFDPQEVRSAGQLKFFAISIQGPDDATQSTPPPSDDDGHDADCGSSYMLDSWLPLREDDEGRDDLLQGNQAADGAASGQGGVGRQRDFSPLLFDFGNPTADDRTGNDDAQSNHENLFSLNRSPGVGTQT